MSQVHVDNKYHSKINTPIVVFISVNIISPRPLQSTCRISTTFVIVFLFHNCLKRICTSIFYDSKKNLTTKLTQKKIYTMNRAYFVKREPLIQIQNLFYSELVV